MKLQHDSREIKRSGNVGQESGYRIQASASAFDILSSKLYKNVPEAIVRELSTNASDAQVEAGNANKPFDVHLPTAFEPWFEIRDYGTGLTEEQVREVYTVYFCSTRSGSDDFTGAFGLGSKSPFAYTDAFTIASFVNGMEYTYSMFKNEQSEPSCALLGKASTDQPNGIKIKIPVASHDRLSFDAAARKVYKWFKVRPNITTGPIEYEDEAFEYQGDGYGVVLADSHYGGPPHVRVVMGQVCYDASGSAIADSEFGRNARVVLFANMGEVTIAASRETLQFDDRTIGAINARLAEVLRDVKRQANAKIDSTMSELDKVLARQKFADVVASYRADGVELGLSKPGSFHLRCIEIGSNRFSIRDQRYIRPSGRGRFFFVHEDVEFKQKHKRRIKHWISEQHGGYNWHDTLCLAKIDDMAEFTQRFGAVTVKLSDLPPAPVNRSGTAVTVRRHIKKLSDVGSHRVMDNWQDTEESDLPDNVKLYSVPRRNAVAVTEYGEMVPGQIRMMAGCLGVPCGRVLGISANMEPKLKKRLGLADIVSKTKEKIEAFIANADPYTLSVLKHGETRSVLSGAQAKKLSSLSTECQDMASLLAVDTSKLRTVRDLASLFKVEIPDAPRYSRVFWKKYPLLRAVFNGSGGTVEHGDVAEYVRLIESKG